MSHTIVILNSSFRKKATHSLLERISTLLGENEIDWVHLRDYRIEPCTGCEHCLLKGGCPIPDEAQQVLGKLERADGIIIGTPVYMRQIPGYLKALIDRGCVWYHRPPLVGKPVFFVTTTQATGSRQTLRYLKDLSLQWGSLYAGHVSRTMFNLEDPVGPSVLKRFLFYLDRKNLRVYRPSLKQSVEFMTQKVLAEEILPLDREFWSEKGYLGRSYYYLCRINPFNRAVSYLYYRMLSYFIGKNKRGST